jgi:hypothetical protein
VGETTNDLRKWIALRAPQPSVEELFLNARGLPMARSGFGAGLAKHVIQRRAVARHWPPSTCHRMYFAIAIPGGFVYLAAILDA